MIINVKILSEVFSVAVKCVEWGSFELKIENTKSIGLCSQMKLLCNSCNLSDSFMYSRMYQREKFCLLFI